MTACFKFSKASSYSADQLHSTSLWLSRLRGSQSSLTSSWLSLLKGRPLWTLRACLPVHVINVANAQAAWFVAIVVVLLLVVVACCCCNLCFGRFLLSPCQ